jgi:hypothetical protein
MTDEIKLLLALNQLENVMKLMKNSEYENYLCSHLILVQVELQRQLTNLRHSTKIKR